MIHAHKIPAKKHPVHYFVCESGKAGINTPETCLILPTMRNLKSAALILGENKFPPDLMTVGQLNKYSLKSDFPAVPNELKMFYLKKAADRLSIDQADELFKGNSKTFLSDYITFAKTGGRIFSFFKEASSEKIDFALLKSHALYSDYEKHIDILESLYSYYIEELTKDKLTDKTEVVKNSDLKWDFLDRYEKFSFLIGGYLTKAETELLTKLADKKEVHLFFRFSGKKGGRIKHIEEQLSIEIPEEKFNIPEIKLYETTTFTHEYSYITEQIYRANADRKIPFEKMAVILPDEDLKRPFLYADKYNLFNVSSGVNGEDTYFYSLLNTVSEILQSPLLHINHARELLENPLIKNLGGVAPILDAFDKSISDGKIYIDRSKITSMPQPARILKSLLHMPEKATLKEAAVIIKKSAEAAHTKSEDNFSRNYLNMFITELEKLILLYSKIDETVRSFEAIQIICSSLSKLSIYKPGGPVTVMGALESRNMKYDLVLIPSLKADKFPPPNPKELFLNTELRKKIGIPTYLDRENLVKNYMMQIIENSKYAVCGCSRDESEMRSAFLDELSVYSKQTIEKISPELSIVFGENSSRTKKVQEYYENSKEVINKIQSRSLSATALNTFISCPYKFYNSYVAKLREEEDIQEEIPIRAIGDIIHSCLEQIYKESLPESEADLYERLTNEFSNLIKLRDAYNINPVEKFKINAFQKDLKEFSKYEMDRLNKGWKPSEFEKTVRAEISGFKFIGHIDRIDEYEGEKNIIDYKFKTTFREYYKFPDKFDDVQLPLYTLMYSKTYGQINGGAFWYQMREKFRLIKAFDSGDIDSFKTYLIENILSCLKDENFKFTRTDNFSKCSYCPYIDICGRRAYENRF